jgi:membrane protease subunit HflC
MGPNRAIPLVILVAALILGWFSIFTVKEWERAVLFRFGEIVKTDFKPGLHFMVPFMNNVRRFDGRVQTLDAEPERFLTAEKKYVIVDAFVKWRIDNVAKYYTAMGGDEYRTNIRLSQIIKDGLRAEFGKRTKQEAVSGERTEIMNVLSLNADTQAHDFGIRVVDVRIKRIDLPQEISESVYRRMEAERDREAKDKRSKGFEVAERIRADADRQRTILLAEADRDAEQTRGEGDAKAAEIYAKAFNKDPEFFAFYRSLNAYRQTFNDQNDVILLGSDSDFFKYFKDSRGGNGK